MFCWSCGHENPDNHKFCGECGKGLFKPEKVVREFRREEPKTGLTDRRSAVKNALAPPATIQPTVTAREAEPPKPTNPLIEEPRVVHEKPLPTSAVTSSTITSPADAASAAPTPIRDRVPHRITGPSFLGLSDEESSRSYESSYLLEDEP